MAKLKFVGLSVRSARQLEAVQQKALSICSVDPACIPSLSERRSSISLRLFFSILDDNVPDHLSGFCHWPFIHTATSRTLRNSVCRRMSAAQMRFYIYSWASLRWAQLIRKSSLMSATLCSTFSVARLTLSSCPTRARPIGQTTQLSAYKLNRFSKEHGSLKRHLICAYPSNQHSQKSEWHSMNVPLGRHPNELHMVVTPRNFYVAVERGSGKREREKMGRG